MAGLVRALLALGEPLEVVALGGPVGAHLPAGIGHVGEPSHPPTNLGWTLVGLPRAARAARVDLIHAPAYTAPFWSHVPAVLTIHDVSYELHPEWYPYRSDWMRRAFYRLSARAAAHILTVSAFSASEIAVAYGIRPDRITVTPLGVDDVFTAPGGDHAALPAGVRMPYVLHVGDLHARRNLPLLVDAVLEAGRRLGGSPALALVLVGVDRGVRATLLARASEAGAGGVVVHLSKLNDTELRALFRGAAAFVYPSLYEGFGLPLLEAMASGTPVIGSTAASIPEVVGDAGLLVDPRDRAGWTDAIVRVVGDPAWSRRLRASGLQRVSQFTWARTAWLTLEVYRRAA